MHVLRSISGPDRNETKWSGYWTFFIMFNLGKWVTQLWYTPWVCIFEPMLQFYVNLISSQCVRGWLVISWLFIKLWIWYRLRPRYILKGSNIFWTSGDYVLKNMNWGPLENLCKAERILWVLYCAIFIFISFKIWLGNT